MHPSYINAKVEFKAVRLFQCADLPIRYHVKIRREAILYDPGYVDYFADRKTTRKLLAISDHTNLNATSYQNLAALGPPFVNTK